MKVSFAQSVVYFLKKLRRYFGAKITVPYMRADGMLGYSEKQGRNKHRRIFKHPRTIFRQLEIKYREYLEKLQNEGIQIAI